MGVPEELPTLDCDATREEASKESEGERGGSKSGSTGLPEKSGAVVAGGLLADLGILEQAAGAAKRIKGRPNIVFILVDEMRFPSVFPAGVDTPAEFLRRFMPNVFSLWQHGVKFEGYDSSGNACSPARATIATGLYRISSGCSRRGPRVGRRCSPVSPPTASCCASSATTRRISASGTSPIHRPMAARSATWRTTASEG